MSSLRRGSHLLQLTSFSDDKVPAHKSSQLWSRWSIPLSLGQTQNLLANELVHEPTLTCTLRPYPRLPSPNFLITSRSIILTFSINCDAKRQSLHTIFSSKFRHCSSFLLATKWNRFKLREVVLRTYLMHSRVR